MNPDTQWQKRANLIMQVQAGTITVTEAAKQLGVSRKTYYEWEKRALSGMAQALQNGQPGRPEIQRGPEKDILRKTVDRLQKDLVVAKQTVEVRDMLNLLKEPTTGNASDSKKKKKSNRKP